MSFTHQPVTTATVDCLAEIFYVARNAKDVAISCYHYWVNLFDYTRPLATFLDEFLTDKILLAPFHSHVLNFWTMRNAENVLFFTYENMKADLMAVVEKAANHLGKSYSKDQLKQLLHHLSFDVMRLNKCANHSDAMNFLTSYNKASPLPLEKQFQ